MALSLFKIADCAAASLAIGIRYGDAETQLRPNLWKKSIDFGSPPCSPQIPSLIFGLTFLPRFVAFSINLPTPS